MNSIKIVFIDQTKKKTRNVQHKKTSTKKRREKNFVEKVLHGRGKSRKREGIINIAQ